MTNRTHTGFLLLVLAAGLAGCDGVTPSSPTAPTAQTTPTPDPVTTHSVAEVTLSGVVFEVTPTGRVPLEGVRVFSSDAQDVETDTNGFFSFTPVWVCPCSFEPWMAAGNTIIWVGKDGYDDVAGQPALPGFNGPGWRVVTISGDTRLDIQLVRR